MFTIAGEPVYPLGFGGWHVGGAYSKNETGQPMPQSFVDDNAEIDGIRANIDLGINYIDVCHHYGYGKSAELIAHALEGYKREDFFINAKLEIDYPSTKAVKDALERYCKILNTDYIDSYQLHGVMKHLRIERVIDVVNDLVDEGKVRYLSVSNLNKEQLADALQLSASRIVSNEINYNLITRVNEDNGVIDRCNETNTPIIAYQPLKRNTIAAANYPLLVQLAKKYGKTQNQILLNRLCNHKKYLALCKSTNLAHVTENEESLRFDMEHHDYLALDDFRPDGYQIPVYDYRGKDDSKLKIWKL